MFAHGFSWCRLLRDSTEPNAHLNLVLSSACSRSKWDGLTPELQRAMSQQFGLEPSAVETRKLDAYAARIPRVLVAMREYLVNNGAAAARWAMMCRSILDD